MTSRMLTGAAWTNALAICLALAGTSVFQNGPEGGAAAPASPAPRGGDVVPAPAARPKGLGISGPGAVHGGRWREMNERVTGSAVKAHLGPG